MRCLTPIVVLLLSAALVIGGVAVGSAAAPQHETHTAIHEYEGQIKSVKIDHCGMQPGSCEGSVILSQPGGREVTLAIKPGTWIERGNQLVLIEDLGVGNYIKARATALPGQPGEQAITLEQATTP